MGRTTLVIDESLLAQAMAASGSRTKTETIEVALRELIRARERERLRRELGTFELDLTLDELWRQRRAGLGAPGAGQRAGTA
jgi:Arc/MetJ family transcription regulator